MSKQKPQAKPQVESKPSVNRSRKNSFERKCLSKSSKRIIAGLGKTISKLFQKVEEEVKEKAKQKAKAENSKKKS